jgi:uncharacterized protein (TIGR02099 family)
MSGRTTSQGIPSTPRERAGWRALLHGGLSRAKTAAIWITAGTLILLAVTVTVLRLVLPLASEYREQVAHELGELLGQRVEIGVMDARWRLLGPRVYLDQVAIFDTAETEPLLRVERLDLGVRVWHSLWERRLRIHSVRVLGADVHVHRDEAGRFEVSGAGATRAEGAATAADGGARLLEMLAGTTFRLQSSRLRYTDQVLDLDYAFDDLNLAVAVEANALRLAGQVFLPPQLGRDLTVGVELSGDPGELGTWQGRVHVRGQGIVIDALPDEALARRVNAQSGIVNLELWGRIAEGRPDRLRARLEAVDVRLEAPATGDDPAPAPVSLERVSADGLWEARGPGAWQLRLHELSIRHAGLPAAGMGLSLAYREENTGRRIWGEMEGIRLDHLVPVALSQPLLDAEQHAWLSALSPSGEITRARFHGRLPDEGDPEFAATGAFLELALEPHERIPGFHGLSGAFNVYHHGGEVSLRSRKLQLDIPRLFADRLPGFSLDGVLHWNRTPDGYRLSAEDVRLRNEDIRARARLAAALGAERRMELEVDFADGDGSRTARYLPAGIMPEATYRWLSRSIVAGRVPEGRLVFRGPLRKFPLQDEEDVFEVRARVVDGVLDYQPGWPALQHVAGELVFDDRGMRVENASGRIFEAQVTEARVRIADYRAAELQVDGQVTGTLADMLRYVRQSPLARGLDDLLDDTRAEGTSGLELSLRMPLHRRGGGPAATRVSGAATLNENRLRLVSQPVDFRQVSGRVAFTEATVSAERVSARLNGEPIVLGARLGRDGPLAVRAEGMQPVPALAQHLPDYLAAHLSGRSRWTGELTVPVDGSGGPVLRLESMLEGVTSRLPEPLGKAAGERVPLRVDVPLGRSRAPMRLRYGSILSGVLRPEGDELHGELRFNNGDALMPERGLRLAGRVDRLDVDAWLAVAEAHDTASGTPVPGGRVSAIDLYADELSTGGRTLRTVRVVATRERERWQAWVDAPALRGEVIVPTDLAGAVPLTFSLEHVDLDLMAAPEGDEGIEAPRPDPRSLPALRGVVHSLIHDGRQFTDLRIEATRMRDGLQFHHLQVATAGGHGTLRASGDWRVLAGDSHQTQLRFDVRTSHLGRMLTDLGFQHGFDRGEGKVEGQLRWPDTPNRFTWEGLEGNGRVEVENGRLVEVEPGAGRLLGLFSLNMLPRRLALDFRDVFQRGFAFERIKGTVRLVGSDLYTSDLRIQGAAANVEIEGRTGIVARDHDQRIVVTPRVGGTLPVAGALLGGPVAGAAVFILDRVLGMSRGIDEAARVEYRVTGSWEDPEVEVVARPGRNGAAEANP